MLDSISLTGVVATDPRHIITTDGLDITSFRLASSQRRYDKAHRAWVDTGTNWYTVTAFRQLAANVATSITKGDRVVAAGRLRIREWATGEKTGTTIEIEADAVGHDLSWGKTSYTKTHATETAASGAASSGAAGDEFPSDEPLSTLAEKIATDGFLPAERAGSELFSG